MMGESDSMNIKVLLQNLVDGINIGTVTEQLRTIGSSNAGMQQILTEVFENDSAEIRQMAAILSKRNLVEQFSQCCDELQCKLLNEILAAVEREKEPNVKKNIANLTGSLVQNAKAPFLKVLFDNLSNLGGSENVETCCAALNGLVSIIEQKPSLTASALEYVKFMIERGFMLGNKNTIIASCEVCEELLIVLENPEDLQIMEPILTHIVKIAAISIEERNIEVLEVTYRILVDAMEFLDILKTDDIVIVLTQCLRLLSDEFDSNMHSLACMYISNCSKKKPNLFLSGDFLNNLIDKLICMLLLSPQSNDEESDEEESDSDIARGLLEGISIHLPNTHFMGKIVPKLTLLLNDADEKKRCAAFYALGSISYGCATTLKWELKGIMQYIVDGMACKSVELLCAIFKCTECFVIHLQPQIMSHVAFIPNLIDQLNKMDNIPCLESYYQVLNVIFENTETEELRKHVNTLFPVTMHLLNQNKSFKLNKRCLGVLGALSKASTHTVNCNQISYYTESLLPLIINIISQGDSSEKADELKSEALQVLGSILSTFESGSQSETGKKGLEFVFHSLETTDSPIIRQGAYRCFCLVLTNQIWIDKYLIERIFPRIFKSIFSEIIDDEIDSDEGETEDRSDYRIRTGFIDEMEAALECFELIWEKSPINLTMPYLSKTLDSLRFLSEHFYEPIRAITPSLIKEIFYGLISANSVRPSSISKMTYTPGDATSPTLQKSVKDIWNKALLPILLKLLENDASPNVVCSVCCMLGKISEEVGPSVIMHHLETLDEILESLLHNTHTCQVDYEDEDVEENSNLGLTIIEQQLYDGIAALICGLAQACGRQFLPYYKIIHSQIMKLVLHESNTYRSIGIGCLAETLKAMGGLEEQYVTSALEPAINGVIQDKDLDLRRNSAYCLGVLYEVTPAANMLLQNLEKVIAAMYNVILPEISNYGAINYAEKTESDILVLDNIAAALSRIVVYTRLDVCLHKPIVNTIYQMLPLKEDLQEAPIILTFLLYCLQFPGYVNENLINFVRVSIAVLADPKANFTQVDMKSKEDLEKALLEIPNLWAHVNASTELLGEYRGVDTWISARKPC